MVSIVSLIFIIHQNDIYNVITVVIETTNKNSETYRYIVLPFFFMFSLFYHNTWHHYLYSTEPLVATLFSQFPCFLKKPSFVNCIFQPFLYSSTCLVKFITNYNTPPNNYFGQTSEYRELHWIWIKLFWQLLKISGKKLTIIQYIFQFLSKIYDDIK